MGYGHQRTAYPLRDIAFGGKVINANHYEGIPEKDKKFWHQTRALYEFISRFKRIPLFGDMLFFFLDRLQKILTYYPKRDLSKPNFILRNIFYFIKLGWGKDLIEKLAKDPKPLVTTFFTPAFMAEHEKYPERIFCVICDADMNRSWVSLEPSKSKIKYFVPCTWVRDRLKLYGVPDQNIFFTGYPLPKENIGENMEIAKNDLRNRLLNLDPLLRYRKMYKPLVEGYLGKLPEKSDHPLTILFSIGGAGAQKEMAIDITRSLQEKIKSGMVKIIIAIGIRKELIKYYTDSIKDLELNGQVRILYGEDMNDYFEKFNQALRKTDILWTKPSELSFYAGLGLPIIIAPCIGSQEEFNRRWLLHIGAGIAQENLKYVDQWLLDSIYAGNFAEMAMQGFVEIEKMGVYNIEKIIK
jgi:hypothetical protein